MTYFTIKMIKCRDGFLSRLCILKIRTIFFFVILFSVLIFAEHPDTTLSKINVRYKLIENASKIFNINQVYLSAVIYTERTNNYDWTDDVFDEIIAKVGKSSSIGFGQIKMRTAYFIERQLSDSTKDFYCGKKYESILEVSGTPTQIIKKLQNDSLNILYASAYLRMMQTFWNKRGYSIDNKPEIIGSLYQLGLFHSDGKVREPHFNPKANEFGEKVKESIELFRVFKNEKYNLFISE